MKKYLTVLILIYFTKTFSQSDLRNVKWGMTVEEVKNAELPSVGVLEKNIVGFANNQNMYNGEQLAFDNVNIDNSNVTIYYYFENGLLNKATFRFNYSIYNSDNSTKSLSMRFRDMSVIFNSLKERNFNTFGWVEIAECLGYENAKKYTNEILEKVEICSMNKLNMQLYFQSSRTNVEILIPTKKDTFIYSKYIGFVKFKSNLSIKKSGF